MHLDNFMSNNYFCLLRGLFDIEINGWEGINEIGYILSVHYGEMLALAFNSNDYE